MRRPTTKPKPRVSELGSFPVPTAGLISNRNLALPSGQGVPPGASVLRNWFPTPATVVLRRGMRRWASMPNDEPVPSLFSYVLGQQQELFAATESGIWNITTVPQPYNDVLSTEDNDFIVTEDDDFFGGGSVDGLQVLDGTTNGDWVVLQFSTIGGTYLIGVNGVDTGFIYDGEVFWPYVEGGVSSLGVAAVPVLWVPGVTITGGTSTATATINRTDAGVLYLTGIVGTFQIGETLTASVAGSTTVNVLASLEVPGITGIASDRLSYVWAYKERVFFAEKDTLDAWYLPIDSIGGAMVKFPMGGVFSRGGSLIFGQNWSLDSGGDGGLSDQCVFVTTEGEVAAYQGLSPDEAATWSKVGVYRIGRPLGKKAFIRAGGDLVIATSIGFLGLGQAIQRDYAALGAVAISNPIADEWRRAVTDRGLEDWQVELWGEGSMVLVAPPTPANGAPVVFVSNSDSGAWTIFDGWQPTSFETFRGRLFMGSIMGRVQEAYVGGSDEGTPYTGVWMPLFADLGTPGSRKVAEFARVVTRSSYPITARVTARFDWNLAMPPVPNAPVIPAGNEWDNGTWDLSIWNAERGTVITDDWVSVGGSGYAASVATQITSGSLVPLDVEIIRADFSFVTADIIT